MMFVNRDMDGWLSLSIVNYLCMKFIYYTHYLRSCVVVCCMIDDNNRLFLGDVFCFIVCVIITNDLAVKIK